MAKTAEREAPRREDPAARAASEEGAERMERALRRAARLEAAERAAAAARGDDIDTAPEFRDACALVAQLLHSWTIARADLIGAPSQRSEPDRIDGEIRALCLMESVLLDIANLPDELPRHLTEWWAGQVHGLSDEWRERTGLSGADEPSADAHSDAAGPSGESPVLVDPAGA